ncbi:hypothetical protein GJAV_G00248810 [Gymnothorax javanicus]|nr:hypothetical protein GJAV_G00248810 [Gymnothorax javanicus]
MDCEQIAAMSSTVAFHTQIASIMEVLANAAVAEICKLVDDGYEVLRLEMSQSQKENKALKRKLQMLELRIARGFSGKNSVNFRPVGVQSCDKIRTETGTRFPCEEGTFAGLPVVERRAGDAVPADRDHAPAQVAVQGDECADMEEGRTESVLVKEESMEEDKDSREERNIREERLVEWSTGSREKHPIQETQNKAANHTEELTEQHRTRRAVWERMSAEGSSTESRLLKEDRHVETLQRRNPLRTQKSTGGSTDSKGGVSGAMERAGVVGESAPTANTRPAGLSLEEPPEQHSIMESLWECTDVGEGSTELVLIKEESAEEDRGAPGEMNNREERLVGSDSHSLGQATSAESLAPPMVYKTRRAVWEASGQEWQSLASLPVKQEKPEEVLKSTESEGDPGNCALEMGPVCRSFLAEMRSLPVRQEGPAGVGMSFPGRKVKRTLERLSLDGGSESGSVAHVAHGHHDDQMRGQALDGAPSLTGSSCERNRPALCLSQLRIATFSAPQRKFSERKRRFICQSCGKAFCRATELEIHQRVHTGERPFGCSQCGKRFSQACNLKTHMSVHTGEKPFRCVVCAKNFTRLSHLKRHQSLHSAKDSAL